jgi:class 3 adenylate cyclase
MVDSTKTIMANVNADRDQKWEAFRLLTEELQKQIRAFGGTTVSFTGDGLLFILEQPRDHSVNVMTHLKNLAGSLEVVCTSQPTIRSLFDDARINPPKLRVGLSFGMIFCGQVGPTPNVIGLPVVEAARISAQKELFEDDKPQILLSESALNQGAEWKIWKAAQFDRAGAFAPKGLNQEIEVFRPRVQ